MHKGVAGARATRALAGLARTECCTRLRWKPWLNICRSASNSLRPCGRVDELLPTLYEIVREMSGATVYRGILGYGAKGHTDKQSFFHVSKDLPISISVVQTKEKLNRAVELIEDMLEDGLIAISDADIVRLVHSDAAGHTA
jgi:PII-like signaling protein